MFCNQCEQTAKGAGCTVQGVCGKQPDTAAVQDLIVYALRGLALVALAAREKGVIQPETDRLMAKALFATLTNVNFDNTPLMALLCEVVSARDALAQKIGYTGTTPVATFAPGATLEALMAQAPVASTATLDANADIASLEQILLYGLKGVAAYADHAAILGQEDAALAERAEHLRRTVRVGSDEDVG